MPELEAITLQTRRLVLRPLVEQDATALFAIFSDPQVMRYWSSAPWKDIGQAYASLATDAEWRRSGDHLRLGIELAAEKRVVGTCTLFDFHRTSRRAELGFALASCDWGSGYMREALTAFIAHSFDVLMLHRLEADIDPRNLACARCLEWLGFRLEGRLRERWIVEGMVSDTDLHGLLRADWDARRQDGASDAPGSNRGKPG